MNIRLIFKVSVFIISVFLLSNKAFALDYPHTWINNIGCDSCHYVYADEPSHLPTWTSHEPQDIDDSPYNVLCWSCHNNYEAPYVKTHSSLQIDDSYGNWSNECRVCHHPHVQRQRLKYESESYLYSGVLPVIQINQPGPGKSQLVKAGAGWSENEYQGLILIPNDSFNRAKHGYKILSNSSDTLVIQGVIDMSYVDPATDTFAIIYGNLVRDEVNLERIMLYIGASTDIPDQYTLVDLDASWEVNKFIGRTIVPNIAAMPLLSYTILGNTSDTLTVDGPMELIDSETGDIIIETGDIFQILADKTGTRKVKFYYPTGMNSFSDGDEIHDGICEVCHTQTNHFRNDGNADDQLHSNMGFPAQKDCTTCHQHINGFRGMGGGAHETHVLNVNGPKIDCSDCHIVSDIPLFKSGTDGDGDGKYNLNETDVCNNCHSLDGVTAAKLYWTNDPGTWIATVGEESFCGSCHDDTPGNSNQGGGGDNAPNVAGDKSTYGFFVTGHGKESGTYQKLSWQKFSAFGNPAANRQCASCHDLTTKHFNNTEDRLKAGFENDINNSNCRQCHEPGVVATGDPQWYTTYDDYTGSAHSSEKCSNCHDVHGASGNHPAMTLDNQETLCYRCHKDPMSGGIQNDALANNRTGGYVSADDIQEAFSKSEIHNLGTTFSLGSGNYTLECISCHNVHIVTGKYWDAEQGKSPVTRFTDNLNVWGNEAGEKMNDFAALGSGSGGFYLKTAQGYQLGATGIPSDRSAVYQPPKDGGGLGAEFSGDVLPDYTSFCLDCHSSRVSDASPPINWGQGISCTDNGVDPPDQRIECGAKHGLGAANNPSYISDEGTAGFWGTSGNPDVLFGMNYVTRGRHSGHFMRWPYDSASRNAGINFVLSCTDCHEAHGADRGSMIRERLNVNAYGDCGAGGDTDPNGENCNDGSNWNSFCNICHYYYGGQHAGMSCGNASCHETNSIHRIIHSGRSGSTQLNLTAAGYESNYERPDFTPDIISVVGHIGSDILTVTFESGVWSNIDLTGFLDKDDFWLFDVNGNNPRTIESVVHTSGSSTATITMSEDMTESDLSTDTIAMKPASVWNWYAGGYNNAANGIIEAQAVSGGPWPETINGPPPFDIQSVLYGGAQLKLNGIISDSNQIYVTFAEGAYSISGFNLYEGDFVLNCGGRIISTVTHTTGESFAILTLDTIVDQSEVGVCTVAAAPNSIFDSYGNPAGTAAVTLALPSEASVNDLILRWDFNEGSGTVANSSGALGTQEDMHGVLTRNVQWAASTKPGTAAGDNVVNMDRVSDRGAVQLNYTINADDNFPPATYSTGGAPVIVQEMQQTSDFSFSVWIKPTALGCDEGKALGLNNKLRRDVLTTQFWIKNWALGIMRFSDDGDPLNGNCTAEDSTHDVLRFWVAVGDPNDMRCDAWGGSWPEYVHPVSPAGYTQGSTLMPTDQVVCDTSSNPILPTNTQAHSFAQTETSASGASTYGGVALQPGVWQHVVGTWDGRYIRIYIDAQLAAETDMGGSGNYIMVSDPHLWGGDLIGDGSIFRHVSSFFAAGARPLFSASGSPSNGAVYWNANGYYDLNSATYVGELDDVKYWEIALPLATIQY